MPNTAELCAIPGKPCLQYPGGGAEQVLEVKLNFRVCMKDLKDEVMLDGSWRGPTDRLPCLGGGFHFKCYLWALL